MEESLLHPMHLLPEGLQCIRGPKWCKISFIYTCTHGKRNCGYMKAYYSPEKGLLLSEMKT